jgi:hypothetical protein
VPADYQRPRFTALGLTRTRGRITQIMKLAVSLPTFRSRSSFCLLSTDQRKKPASHRQEDRLVRAAPHVSEDPLLIAVPTTVAKSGRVSFLLRFGISLFHRGIQKNG